jgi:basic membrane lipoprotein Med (substrate-binding protein (PBP1-ABC) superfamily)
MEGMIQQGAKLIFATSFGHQQSAFNLAKKHPDVVFEHAGGWMQAANFGNFFGATQAAWYPMGVAAGAMTKSNTLGFVAGVPIGYLIGNINAFALGARSVNPKAEVHVVVTGSWSDKAKEAAAAGALIDQGADVVTMHVDSPATVIQTAERQSVYSIGFQSIEARTLAPKGWITGLGFTWGPFMTETAKNVMAGTFKPAMVRLGLGQGMMAVAPFGSAVPDATRALVTAAADKVGTGFNPFTGPITDNAGAVRIPAGEAWGGDKMGSFDWYVRRPQQGEVAMADAVDPAEFVPRAAAVVGLPLAPDDLADVIDAFAVLARAAGLVMTFPLSEEIVAAALFTPDDGVAS